MTSAMRRARRRVRTAAASGPPTVVHVTSADMSLVLLLGPQLRAFAAAGYRVLGASAPGPYVPELESWGITHVPLRHATRAIAPGHDVLALGELVTIFRRLRPDIVHTHNPKPGIYGRIAARWAGVPAIVNTVHGLYATPGDSLARRSLVYSLERVAAACSDAELVQNVEDLEELARIGVARPKLRLLGNGVDLERFCPDAVDPAAVEALRREFGAGPGDVVVGLVGRLVWEKGYREVFEAAARLRASHPTARFVIVGPAEPDKHDGISSTVTAEASRRGIHFAGERSDMATIYAAFDLFVLASYREGFPRSAMEASAMGRAVVATNIRGCRQAVDDGATGVLVAPRDADALGGAIATLVVDDARRRRMGAAAREKALREFDDRRVIETTLEVYQSLLGRRP